MTTSFSNHSTNKVEFLLHCSRDARKSPRKFCEHSICVYCDQRGINEFNIIKKYNNLKKKCI